MKISYKRSVAPTSEPVDIYEAANHLEIDHTDRDDKILRNIKTAREIAEHYTNRSFFTQTWIAQLDKFPKDYETIELLYGPIQSISSLKYYDVNNTQQTWSSSNYRLDNNSNPGLVEAVDGWPDVYDRIDAVEITYIAGETSISNIESSIKDAILMIVGDLYEVRQNMIIGSQVNLVSRGAEYLLDKHKIYHVAK